MTIAGAVRTQPVGNWWTRQGVATKPLLYINKGVNHESGNGTETVRSGLYKNGY